MEEKINNIKTEYTEKIRQAKSLKELDEIFLELFGKNGKVTLLPREFPNLERQVLRKVAPLFNKVKQQLEKEISDRRYEIREEGYKKLESEKLDLETLNGSSGPKSGMTKSVQNDKKRIGHLHPITRFENQIVEIFRDLGFQLFDAPHIDSDYYNFEALNIPEDHPARDLWDTLYVSSKLKTQNSKLLLRTHTSNAQIRIMRELEPPIRIMVIDRFFRYENLDARHEHTTDQFEIVYIDKGVNMANLQYLSEYFLKHVFGKDIKARLRPKYYPFVEPGAGVEGECIFCKGKGCKVCGGIGWLELAGAGMIHPQVLKNGGIDPNIYSGLAWGAGPARMAMLKYGVEDLRLFNSGDLKFLERF